MMDVKSLMLNSGASFRSAVHGRWLQQNWWTAIILSILYVVAVFVGKHVMASRSPFDLRRPLVLWSSGLTLFSFAGTVVMSREFASTLRESGWDGTVCSAVGAYNGESGFWLWLFVLSKAIELGDTAFIVLRKQRLMLLHWYHHASTLAWSWFLYSRDMAVVRYFATLNFGVHFVMYLYYALSAAGVLHRPRRLKIAITATQMVQFVISLLATSYAAYHLTVGNSACDADWPGIFVATQMYMTYFFMFSQFAYETYIKTSHKVKA